MSPLARHDSSPNRHRSNTRASDQRRPTESAHTTNLWTLKSPQFGNTIPHFDGLCFCGAHPVCLWISLKLARGSKDPQPTHQCCGRHFSRRPGPPSSRLSLLWRLTSLFSLPPLFLVRLSAHSLIPYVRQAVTFSVRRHLAACVRDAIVVLRLRPGFRQLRTLYPLCLSLTPVMPWMLSLQPPQGAACLVCCWCVRSPSRPSGSRVVPCWCCCRWSWCVRLSAPPCAPLFGPRVSAVRRPFPPYMYSIPTIPLPSA